MTIIDMELNDSQKKSLEDKITAWYTDDQFIVTGLEVTHVSSYGLNEYRVFYTYEVYRSINRTTQVATSDFFRFDLRYDCVEDLRGIDHGPC